MSNTFFSDQDEVLVRQSSRTLFISENGLEPVPYPVHQRAISVCKRYGTSASDGLNERLISRRAGGVRAEQKLFQRWFDRFGKRQIVECKELALRSAQKQAVFRPGLIATHTISETAHYQSVSDEQNQKT